MPRWLSPGKLTIWILALGVAVLSMRYFFVPPPLLTVGDSLSILRGPAGDSLRTVAPYLYRNHRALLLTHIGSGIIALTFGLFQFVGSIRSSRPFVHRLMGYSYVAAVVLSGASGFPLTFKMLEAQPLAIRAQFYPMLAGLASASIAWPLITLIAVACARKRRFADHRAWTIRSYALTFLAPSSRVLAPVLLLLTGSVVFSVNAAFLSWPLNLVVAEWLIRRGVKKSSAVATPAISPATLPTSL